MGSLAATAVLPDATPNALHRTLRNLSARRLHPATPDSDPAFDADLRDARKEEAFLQSERAAIAARAALAPQDPDRFVAWFEALKQNGPGQGDPLFPWLAEHADRNEMKWFLEQEFAGEAGFDDLVALSQRKIDKMAKLEMARNYWDEMGAGHADGMHGPMLDRLVEEFGIRVENPVWESLALANLMMGLAFNRRYAYHAIGALGAVELTAPGRCVLVAKGLERLGLSGSARRYYSLHAVIDIKHAERWNAEVLRSLVDADPSRARWLAEGALMRLEAGARTFERYRRELWGASERVSDACAE